MFVVYGKSLLREKNKKHRKHNHKVSDETALQEFYKNTGAYQISPEYSSEERCIEFIKLAKLSNTIRCLYIAKLIPLTDKEGCFISNEITGKPKMKYLKFKGISTQ